MQQITPIEIRQKSFEKSFKGYNIDEVNAFLNALAYAWEKLLTQLSDAEDALEKSGKEIKRLQGVENALLKTMKDAETTAHNIIEHAKREVGLKMRETEMNAEKVIHEAQAKAKAIEEDSQRRQIEVEGQMERSLARIKEEVQEREAYRDALLQKLRHLAEEVLIKSQPTTSDVQHHGNNNEDLRGDPNIPTSLEAEAEGAPNV